MLCALVAVSTLPPGGSREAASAPGVWWGQQQNSPTPSSLNSSNPVSPWPKYLGNDPSHRRCRGSSEGVQPNKPQNSAWSVPCSEEKLAGSWSQQDKARVAELPVNLQQLLGYVVGADLILRAELVTQGLHLAKQFLVVGVDLV